MAERTKNFSSFVPPNTDEKVGPGKYVTEGKFTSKHRIPSSWSVPRSQRKGMVNKTTVNETYEVYSSMGRQLTSKKRTETMSSLGKERKDKMTKGILPSHMNYRPTRVSIPIPHF